MNPALDLSIPSVKTSRRLSSNMHLHSTLTILSTLGFAATSVAYDSISFTTWNCTDCTPVPGIFCSTGTRGNLPPNECYPMWNGSFTMKTFGATLPSCQGIELIHPHHRAVQTDWSLSEPLHKLRLQWSCRSAQGERWSMREQGTYELVQAHLLRAFITRKGIGTLAFL